MNIKLINKFLYFDKYRLRCAIGKRGITYNKKEGDQKTPGGTLKFKYIFYRKDRIVNFRSQLKKKKIKKNMGWCDCPNSMQYNKLISFPFKESAEKLWLKNKIYDILIVTSYNTKPVNKRRGSAIFLHLAKKKYTPTKGCISINKKDMLFLIKKINNKTKLIIT